jgi:MYXO-CTERM domain-containing protein
VTSLRIAAFLAAALAASPAAAYERTRGTTGVELAWRVPAVPWALNRARAHDSPSCAAAAAGDPTLAAVRASFAAWEQPCAELRLLYAGALDEIRVGAVGSSENLVVLREGWCSNHPDAKNDPCMDDPDVDCGNIYNCFEDHPGCASPCPDRSVVALTSVLYDPRSGRIYDADIELNGWDGLGSGDLLATPLPDHGWYFTCQDDPQPLTTCTRYGQPDPGQPDCKYIDLRNTLTHEVGHFVGFAHVPPHLAGAPQDTWSTMEEHTGPGVIWMRSLAPDDVAGVCAVYPPSGGGCGCGSGGAGGMGALLLAALALRRRAR